MRHLPSNSELLETELHRALQRHGGRHGDHGSGEDCERAAHCELHGDDRVGVAVGDAVAAAVERADVVHRCRGAGEVVLGRCAAGHRALAGGVVGLGRGLLFLGWVWRGV